MVKIINTLGKRLNKIRKLKGITSEKLSELCDVNAVHIRLIESGNRMPSLSLLIKICNVLEVSADYLLGLENPISHENDLKYQIECLDIDFNKLPDILKILQNYFTLFKDC